jgi:hypothetical protein
MFALNRQLLATCGGISHCNHINSAMGDADHAGCIAASLVDPRGQNSVDRRDNISPNPAETSRWPCDRGTAISHHLFCQHEGCVDSDAQRVVRRSTSMLKPNTLRRFQRNISHESRERSWDPSGPFIPIPRNRFQGTLKARPSKPTLHSSIIITVPLHVGLRWPSASTTILHTAVGTPVAQGMKSCSAGR